MSTYSNRLQPAFQNLLQRVVWFVHPRSSCTTTHISADVQRITLNASCMTISGGRTKQLIYSAASLALRVIFSVSCCGTYSVLSRSPSIIHADDIIHAKDIVWWRTHSNHLVMMYVCVELCMLA